MDEERSTTYINIWSFGITSFPVLLYILPLIVLGCVSYQEIIKGKVYTFFIKILLLVALCLGTVATNINVFSTVFGVQSLPIKSALFINPFVCLMMRVPYQVDLSHFLLNTFCLRFGNLCSLIKIKNKKTMSKCFPNVPVFKV